MRLTIARTLFEWIEIEDNKAVFVKPRPDSEPFFTINFQCHAKDMGCDPEGLWIHIFNTSKSAFSQYVFQLVPQSSLEESYQVPFYLG